MLLDGPWLYRVDPTDAGLAQRFYSQTGVAGWSHATVPSAWNVGDTARASSARSPGTARTSACPRASRALAWIARFESVNFRATMWLNGRKLGDHVGGYVPFELDLPNVDTAAASTASSCASTTAARCPRRLSQPIPATGWWNYGGMQREVSLRTVDRVDVADVLVSRSCRARAARRPSRPARR